VNIIRIKKVFGYPQTAIALALSKSHIYEALEMIPVAFQVQMFKFIMIKMRTTLNSLAMFVG